MLPVGLQVKAISRDGDEELCAVSEDLMRQHLNTARSGRILMQVYNYARTVQLHYI